MKVLLIRLTSLIKVSLILLLVSCSEMENEQSQKSAPITVTEEKIEATSKESQFQQINNANWQQVMFDRGDKNWREHWLVDGLIGSVENTPKGMHVKAGPEAKNHAHHLVVWTKKSFDGDIKIDYEYTRTDNQVRYVSILYLQATGEGTPGFDKDIMNWADYRQEPYMRHYFDNMNTYHISYAAFGMTNNDADKDYVRARRYMPLDNKGLKGTELAGDSFGTGLFKTGVPHQITVIKKGTQLWMKVANKTQSKVLMWDTTSHPEITAGRIGLRHMFTRSAIYKNFTVSTLTEK
ncbi:DUF1961 family protein [Catenovulum maritimum]|uniref:DUF1961 family protein n=1 Tax=Catenovulum maritimum TaxID=1513271 RepID=UPI00066014E2|nr:DUF1961 family protein [Catenovulum maritimum]